MAINPANYTWTQSKTTVTGTHKTISGKTVKLEVGEDYNYTVTGVSGGYTGSWGILGAGETGTSEAGKLLIMTTSNVVDTFGLKGKTGDGTSDYTAGYNNGIAKLNEICVQKCGTGARSINVDDINRVTGYDPENQGDGTVYAAGYYYEYGNVVTYTASKTTSTKYTTQWTGGLSNSVYYHPDGRQIGGTGGTQVSSIKETSTFYWYYPYSLTTSNAVNGTCNGISTSSKAYEMIFGGRRFSYWLASSCVSTYVNSSEFYMRYVSSGGFVNVRFMWASHIISENSLKTAIRAVITL